MQSIPQVEEKDILLQARVPERYRRHLRVEAARRGVSMGELLQESLDSHIGAPPPPAEPEAAIDAR